MSVTVLLLREMLDQNRMEWGVGEEAVLYLATAEKESCLPPARGPRDRHYCKKRFLAPPAAVGGRSTCVHFLASGSGRTAVADTSFSSEQQLPTPPAGSHSLLLAVQRRAAHWLLLLPYLKFCVLSNEAMSHSLPFAGADSS